MADDDVDSWIETAKKENLCSAIIDIHGKIHDLLEYKRSKSNSVTAPVINTIRKALEYVLKRCTELSEENKVLRTRLEDRAEYSQLMGELAQKISRTSVSSVEDVASKAKDNVQKRRDEHTMVLTPNTEQQDLVQIKDKIKEICRVNINVPVPNDVIMTKSRQVILKYKNKKDLELVKNALVGSDELKAVAKINVPVRRRERILILSVDPKITEEVVKNEVESLLKNNAEDIAYGNIREKLEDAHLDPATKTLLEGILSKTDVEVRVIRKIETKMGKVNWLLDIDADCKKVLLNMKRICVDYERYRVVEFVSITRCFKCQKYGHMANNCDGETQCVKCAGNHLLRDCKSETIRCANCYHSEADGDCAHRADSADCPEFKKYRLQVLPNRS